MDPKKLQVSWPIMMRSLGGELTSPTCLGACCFSSGASVIGKPFASHRVPSACFGHDRSSRQTHGLLRCAFVHKPFRSRAAAGSGGSFSHLATAPGKILQTPVDSAVSRLH